MWLNFVCFLELLIAANALVVCSPKSCKSTLQSVRPVCGSDGFTYPNKCVIQLARCFNSNITQTHKGLCRKQRTCTDYVRTFPFHAFKPQCRSDGNYASSQCNDRLGYCWCVTNQGVPMPYTLTQYSPNEKLCETKKSARRRSPSQPRKPVRTCRREDRAKFNNNLIEIFQSELRREVGTLTTNSDEAYSIVLDWKFRQMDQDRNDMLDKTEYRDLRRIVKKAVKPKRCAKNFAKACDMNRDQLIGRQEWSDCLTRDGSDGSTDSSNSDSEEEEDDVGESVQMSSTQRPPHGVLFSDGRILNDEDSSERRDEDAIDCRADRQSALNEMIGNTSSNLYVPECTPDGRYQKIQCYKGAGYCWCVHEDTGKNIPGTSVKDKIPKCDQNLSFTRSMKGCSEEKKIVFLKNLMNFLHDRMAKDINGTNIASANGPSWKASREEQVATWSFVVFDKNKNKVLDKNEWKSFKDSVVAAKNLRKCSKKLPRYCDINKDRQISMTEWLECLNTNKNVPEKVAGSPTGSKRTGTNPLKTYLID